MGLYELASRLGTIQPLDRLADPLTKVAGRLFPHGPVKDAVSGTWLGHPLHPLLTDVVIGSLTSASVLDIVGGDRAQPAANTLAVLGIASALPTATAGLSDWSDSSRADRRLGIVHAAANVVGLGFYAASVRARSQGRRAAATSAGLAGMAVMTVGGYLGGHLSYSNGVGVNNTFWQHGPDDWTPVLDDADLPARTPVRVDVDGAAVLLYRADEGIRAIANRCSHAGGPLDEGEIDHSAQCVMCPWHQSVFRLADGSVVHGPATAPQPAYDVRVAAGRIEVRAS